MIIVEGLSGYRPRLFEPKLGYRKASVLTSVSVYLLVLSSEQAQSQVSSENADFGHRLRLSGEIPPGWRPLRPLSGGGGGGGGGYSVAPLKAATGAQDGYRLSPLLS